MSEYGSGITLWRKDGESVSLAEAEALVALMNEVAHREGRSGAFEEEADCGLGWEDADGGYTLVATSSPAYHASLPEELMEEAMQDDLAFGEWLIAQLEAAHPGVYRFEVDEHEW